MTATTTAARPTPRPPHHALPDAETLRTEVPHRMQQARRWLLWRLVLNADPTKKPRKVPYYVDGTPRNGELDTPADLAQLTDMETAIRALEAAPGAYAGPGFALGPDGNESWQGIDLDHTDTRPELAALVDMLPGYVERSPSGTGVHALGYGPAFVTLGSNGTGIEAYCRGRYFTVTGDAIGGGIVDLAPFVEGTLLALHTVRIQPGDRPAATETADAATFRDLRSALFSMRADDRDLWVKFGHALHGLGDQGRGLWLEWSATSEKFEPMDAARTWDSFKPLHSGYQAVFAEAQRNGWVNPARRTDGPPPPEAGDPGPLAYPGGGGDTGEAPRAEWPEPQELTAKLEPEPYPADALPETIRLAVEEVARFVQAPVPLVAGSALAAVSVACQGYVNVQRAEKLHGPVGLFLLSIADSGERKSTCDGFFATAIRDWEAEQAEALAPDLERYKADLDAWDAEREGLLSAIKSATAKGKDPRSIKADLVRIQAAKPAAPRVPRVLLGDETPENLAWSLAKIWPAAGVLSSEAGVILGAHGMGKESVLRNLALLNVLWDGGVLPIGRRTSESFTLRGARLTVGLQVQGAALRDFFERTGALARGVGFLARFLVAWPDSTQGQRLFREPPQTWPRLTAFHSRLANILREPLPIDDDRGLSPALLTLAPAAKGAWVAFHDAIEVELADGGELREVRDVASKTADNAARLGALFHMFEGGAGPVSLAAFEGASRIAAWHLSESRRFFGELALPAELADATRLDAWLIDYCRRERACEVGKSVAMQYGPTRKKASLDAAIKELCELDRLRVSRDGRRTVLKVNPGILGFANANPANPANTRGGDA